jgi:hypothetical protein
MMQKNLRGELTSEDKDDSDLEENDILKMEDETKIKEMLFPALICDYVIRENVEGLKAMKKIVSSCKVLTFKLHFFKLYYNNIVIL